MEASIFLAKILGIYMVIAGLLYLARPNVVIAALDDYVKQPAVKLVSGVFTLVLGLLMVSFHSVWEFGAAGLITLIGYLTIFKGVVHMFCPDRLANMVSWLRNGQTLKIVGGISVLLGLYLAFFGWGVL